MKVTGRIHNRKGTLLAVIEKLQPDSGVTVKQGLVDKVVLPEIISSDIGFEMIFGSNAPHDLASPTNHGVRVARMVPMRTGIKNSAR